MKLEFRGWHREVTVHEHELCPVSDESGTFIPNEEGGPLRWATALEAHAKISDVALTGSFLVTLSFRQEELRNWLLKYAKSQPEAALRLLGKAQAEAVIALARMTEKSVEAQIEEYLGDE